jgi:RNA polymerase sigma factor (sigma-70 family)
METVAERLDADAALRELPAAPSESLPVPFGDLAKEAAGAGTAVADFSACYAREMSSLVWFVMSLGADAHRAADVAQSAFAEAFAVWDRIQHPTAWLRRVAGRLYYRHLLPHETSVDEVPDRQGPLSAAGVVELHDEARAVLAALADLPPKQRQVMAWTIDGFSPAEIARELDVDPATVRQSLAKARKNLKQLLGIAGGGHGRERSV